MVGNPQIPDAVAGEVSVVVTGPVTEDSGTYSVTAIVRNGTDAPVYDVKLDASVSSGGQQVATGGSISTHPYEGQPGEWAFANIRLDGTVPDGATVERTVTSADAQSGVAILDLRPTEAAFNGTGFSAVVEGSLVNDQSETITGPIAVSALCFDSQGLPNVVESGFSEDSSISAGGTGTFEILVFQAEGREVFAVGANGFGL